MPVTTKQLGQEQVHNEDAFAKQLDAMLGSLGGDRSEPIRSERAVTPDRVTVDEVLTQANDGISLAQIIDITMQQAGDQLANLYYQIESASQSTITNYVDLNNSVRQSIDQLADMLAQVQFQEQAIFQAPTSRRVPTGVKTDEFVTLQIPNTALNQLGASSWQLRDGPIMPTRHDSNLAFRFNSLRLQTGQRVRLMLGEADVLQECMGGLQDTMQQVADIINQAELDWLNNAIINGSELTVTANGIAQACLQTEQQGVAVEDSLATLQVTNAEHAKQAMQVIIGAINMLADYRDVAVSVANDLHTAMNDLMNAPALQQPLAQAMVHDVQKMFEQQPVQAVVAQANTES